MLFSAMKTEMIGIVIGNLMFVLVFSIAKKSNGNFCCDILFLDCATLNRERRKIMVYVGKKSSRERERKRKNAPLNWIND